MIFKSASPLSPRVEITIDNVPVNYLTLQKITIEEKENMHGMAILDFVGMDPTLIKEYVNAPLSIKMEIRDRPALNFYGYIIYLEPTSVTKDGLVNKSPFQAVRAYCFGPSYKMKSKKARSWDNVTLAEIVQEFAEYYSFSASVPESSFRFPRLVQSSQSDWGFLTETVKDYGYAVLMEGTHIHVWDAFKTLYHTKSYSMLMNLRGTGGDPRPQPGQILKFESRVGTTTTDGSRSPDTIHLLDRDGQLLTVTSDPSTESTGYGTAIASEFPRVMAVNADSHYLADAILFAELRKKFPVTAQVETVADPSIKVGGVVRINEYNTEFDGLWYVQSVEHELTQSNLITRLNIARDSFGNIPTNIQTSSPYETPPAPVFQNGVWRSSLQQFNTYA